MRPRKVVVPQIERRSHDSASVKSDPPATGPGDLGDQAVSVKPAKGPANHGAFLSGIVPAGSQMNRRCEPCPDVAVAKASQAMLASHEALE